MIRDRGNIKWTSLMLPEHVEMLREWAREDQYKIKPDIDEQQLIVMNEILEDAIKEQKKIVVTHYHERKYCLLAGTVHYYDQLKQQLDVMDKFGYHHLVKMEDILDIRYV